LRILVEIGHPADVHLFKNLIWELQKRGHEVKIVVLEKDINKQLLDLYGFNYTLIGKKSKGIFNKLCSLFVNCYRFYNLSKKFNQDVSISIGSPYSSVGTKLIGGKSIAFNDTEHSVEQYMLYAPFTDIICTPSAFNKNLGKKQIRYDGYHSLAYLHPAHFQPDPTVLSDLNINIGDVFFIIRFISWNASHDIGQKGFSMETKKKLVSELSKFGRVMITSEGNLPKEFEPYRISVALNKIHDLLYYSTLYIGEGGTMASEAAVLGTPSVFVNSLSLGYLNEQEHKYGLTVNVHDSTHLFDKLNPLLERKDLKKEWAKKREAMLKDKIDVTKWMVDFFENYHR